MAVGLVDFATARTGQIAAVVAERQAVLALIVVAVALFVRSGHAVAALAFAAVHAANGAILVAVADVVAAVAEGFFGRHGERALRQE